MNRLEGKIALVTGGGRGLGAAIARRFREEGATVLVNDIAARVPDTLLADVADSRAVAGMFEEVGRRHGRLDVLVNNAGISGVEGQTDHLSGLAAVMSRQAAERAAGGRIESHLDVTMHLPDESWRRVLAVHLDGTFFCSREAL